MSYLDVTPESHPRPKRLGKGIVIAVIAVLLVAAAVVVLSGGGSFAELVEMTEEAEGSEAWLTYFTAEDCFLQALTEAPEAFEEATERLESETAKLANHVDQSLIIFNTFGTRPWQDELRNAHEAIVAHYVVWEEHLTRAGPILAAINAEPTAIAQGIQLWLEQAQAAVEPISSTFEDAGVAFEAAATQGGETALIESLFVPAEVSCTRTAV